MNEIKTSEDQKRNNERCALVQELLPLYQEGLVSEQSQKIIEEHLVTCNACQVEYEHQQNQDLAIQKQSNEEKVIDYFRQVKRKMTRRTILFSILGFLIASFIFLVAFIGVIPVEKTEANVKYEVNKTTDPISNETVYRVEFYIALDEGKILNNRREMVESQSGDYYTEVKLYRVLKVPFDNRGENPHQMKYGFEKDRPFDENDLFVLDYRDGKVTYSLKNIAEEAGIQ